MANPEFMYRLLPILGVFLLLIASYALFTDVAYSPTTNDAEPDEPATIGETVETEDIDITVNDVRISHGMTSYQPSSGKVFLLVEIEVAHSAPYSEPLSISLADHFHLIDEDEHGQLSKVLPSIQGTLEQEIPPGQSVEGELAWEVSPDAQGLHFMFEGDSLVSGDATIYLGDVEEFFGE